MLSQQVPVSIYVRRRAVADEALVMVTLAVMNTMAKSNLGKGLFGLCFHTTIHY